MSSPNHKLFAVVSFVLLSNSSFSAQPSSRISRDIDDTQRVLLSGNISPVNSFAKDQGPVSGSYSIPSLTLHFTLTAAQNADLSQLLHLQQTRNSKQFHKWLTPEQYAEQFGLNEKDIQKVTLWLELNGFSNIQPSPSRNSLMFSGTAAQIQSAFQASIHQYSVNGVAHFANANAPEIPKALQGIVQSIRGLDNFSSISTPAATSATAPRPHYYNSQPTIIGLAPSDVGTIYDISSLWGAGINGAGRTIAVAGQSDVQNEWVNGFLGHPLQTVLAGTDPGEIPQDEIYSEAQLEWVGSIAHGATVTYVNSSNTLTSVQYVIQNNLADVLTFFDTTCESDAGAAVEASRNSLFQQAAAEGISVITTNVSESCLSNSTSFVSASAASPYVTGVGGTSFNDTAANWPNGNATGYIPEYAAYSGGASLYNSKPIWQSVAGVPADGHRDVPDFAFFAGGGSFVDQYQACLYPTGCIDNANARGMMIGGGELASACIAGIAAMLNQQTGERQGNLNPSLYTLASFSKDAFHTPSEEWFAASTYDLATGLGTPDVANMFREWVSNFQISANPASLTLSRGSSASSSLAVTALSNFSGTINFTCAVTGTLTNVTCSVPGTVTGSGSVTLTVTAASQSAMPFWPRRLPPPYLPLALLFATGAYFAARKRKVQTYVTALCIALLLTMASCGNGSSSGLPPESGSIIVTGTSGLLSNSSTVAVTLN